MSYLSERGRTRVHVNYMETRLIDGTIIERKCTECNQFKKLSEFYLNLRCYLGTTSKCKECLVEKQIKNRLKKYDLNRETFEEITNKGCIICGRKNVNFHIEHDHESGKFRGILCESCNKGLGSFRDNPNLLLKAAAYLEEFNRRKELEVSPNEGR